MGFLMFFLRKNRLFHGFNGIFDVFFWSFNGKMCFSMGFWWFVMVFLVVFNGFQLFVFLRF